MNRQQKKGRLTLHTFYPVTKYMAAALAAISYPLLSETTWLMPGVTGPRAFMMLWTAFLLGISLWMDRSYARAEKKDLEEIQNHVRYGNMNRSTLLALGVPCLFILDLIAIIHLYLSYFRGGAGSAGGISLRLHIAAMACGVVLFIYGSYLPRLSYGSVWGLKVRASMKNTDVWKRVHASAAPCALLGGALILLLGTFLPDVYAFAAAVIVLACCLARMFMIAAKAR